MANIESQQHFFSVRAAKEVGVNAAIILQNLYFWVAKNEANDTNFHDGRYWTYNSVAAFAKLFPYLSRGQINGAIKKLEEQGYIVSGNYNENKYVRTKWYALTSAGFELVENEKCISKNRAMDSCNSENEFAETSKCNISTDNKPDEKPYTYRAPKEKPVKPVKHKHGEYGHVMLTDQEYETLNDKVDGFRDYYIKAVDEYCEQSGKTYRNYSLAIQNFHRRDKEQGKIPKAKRDSKPLTFADFDAIYEESKRREAAGGDIYDY